MPLFSVIIPTYNRAALVGETLDSLFAQQYEDYEVIVVDDGSTDATLDVVRSYGDRVQILTQDHGGCAAARNLGARHAAGKYLAFLDSDDLWFPWTLKVFAKAIEQFEQPTMVAGKLFPFSDHSQVISVEEQPSELTSGSDFLSAALKFGFALGVAHTVVSRGAYLAVGGCLEEDINGTDSDVLLKMGTAPGFVLVRQPYTLAYRHHGGSTTFNVDKGYGGIMKLLQQERDQQYPGGPARREERMGQILIRARAVSLKCVLVGRSDLGMRIYREILGWNFRQGRWGYLASLPLFAWIPPLRRLAPGAKATPGTGASF